MTLQIVWFITGAGRAMGLALAVPEPSHIHVTRRGPVARAGDADSRAARRARPGAAYEYGGQRQPVAAVKDAA